MYAFSIPESWHLHVGSLAFVALCVAPGGSRAGSQSIKYETCRRARGIDSVVMRNPSTVRFVLGSCATLGLPSRRPSSSGKCGYVRCTWCRTQSLSLVPLPVWSYRTSSGDRVARGVTS
jgi:hypothetical protein